MSKIQVHYLILTYDVEMQSNTTVGAILCTANTLKHDVTSLEKMSYYNILSTTGRYLRAHLSAELSDVVTKHPAHSAVDDRVDD